MHSFRIITAAMVCAGGAAAASAGILSHTFDITGLASSTGFGGAFPTLTHDFGVPGTVIMVLVDVNYEAFSPSWVSEAQIAVDTDDDSSFDGDVDPADFGAPDSSGVFAYVAAVGASSVSSNGLVHLTLYESFNDGAVDPDAIYRGGSTVTVRYDAIPAPGALALAGAAGLAAGMRRRRN